MPEKPSQSSAARLLIVAIFVAIFVWGAALAWGAYLHGGAMGVRNGILVLACTAAFLLFWMLLLRQRKHRR